LAEAIVRLSTDPQLLAVMGARAMLDENFTRRQALVQ
jgi:hypothetical protein